MYGVFETRLSGGNTGSPREYLAGNGKGKYSVADIAAWPWINNWRRPGITEEEIAQFPHLLGWIARIAERPAVKRGISEIYDYEKNPELRVATKK